MSTPGWAGGWYTGHGLSAAWEDDGATDSDYVSEDLDSDSECDNPAAAYTRE